MTYRGHVLDTQWDIPVVKKAHSIEFGHMMFYLLLKDRVKDILSRENLLHINTCESMQEKLVNYVYDVARACVKNGLKSSKIERIDIVAYVKVETKINIPNNIEENFVRVQSESMEDDKKVRFGASKTSIDMLERKKQYEKEEELEACIVCKEDFLIGEDIIVMHCIKSHIFHEECLVKWLEESHVCPLCRFELPKDN
ncbi:hypothetical protein FRX31_005778 [Thalictrum thalictroides]|uniref:RING-type domain-containing protein n=1 Tax=Thalictrum thalictroides TaxID=46969 RepID=A0A7J6X6F3_THATH|nr:hypothetical protein FRX31_005778 [Thalictrum thalictroides]